MRRVPFLLLSLVLLAGFAGDASAHCQVPCGIYTDEMRFQVIEEHLTTIEKAMAQIGENSSPDAHNPNQVVRWVTTKETHAQEIQDIVSAYFLTQRIKSAEGDGEAKYLESLRLCHALLVGAMKCKQTTDPANVAATREALAAFHDLYFEGKDHDHE